MRVACAVCIFCAMPFISFSQNTDSLKLDPICVSATKSETKLREIGSSLTIIDQADIEKKQSRTVLEALRNVPGLDIVQTGGAGQKTSVFMRGANSEHTLVMIDGVIMNDPMSPGRSYDFASLTTENIDRIEILRGPQSTLYGSDAIGGVINIISKKGKGKPSFFLSSEAGSFSTFIERAGLSGASNIVDYSIGTTQMNSQGISAAGAKYGNTEKDGYGISSVLSRVGIQISDRIKAGVTVKADRSRSNLDNSGGIGGDDPNNRIDAMEIFARPSVNFELFDKKWSQELSVSYSNHHSTNDNAPDSGHPIDSLYSTFVGQLLKAEWKNVMNIFPTNTIILGVELGEENGSSRNYFRSLDWYDPSKFFIDSSSISKTTLSASGYLQVLQAIANSLHVTGGLRFDHNDKFGNQGTYRTTAAYWLSPSHSKIRAAFGTGFKAPSLYQLYSPYGDKNLKPEKSSGVDGGIEQFFWNDKICLEASLFFNHFDNLIDFNNSTSKYSNVSTAEMKGGECNFSVKPFECISLTAHESYTNAMNLSTGTRLLERPKFKGGLSIDATWMEKLSLHGDFMYVGKRMDYPDIRMDSYDVVNIAASYVISSHFSITGRIDNLLNADYEIINGYGTPGISGYGGVKVTF